MMENGNAQLDALPADCIPAPVCQFTLENGTAVVSGTNYLFDDQLLTAARGEPLSTVLRQFETEAGWETIQSALEDGEQFTLSSPARDGSYLVNVTQPDESGDGYLLFTDTAEISNEAVDEGETDATDTGLAVDHVASVVSHDLRNPLDVARARLDAAREFDEDEHFVHVEKAHDRMERIIQDVLTLARGEDVVDPDETVDLGAVAKQAWETVETNGATLTVEDDLPTTLADPDRISRLFENLFRNAVEHGSSGDGTVQVTVGRLVDGSTDGFYLADNGPGIPEDRQAHVFEPGHSSDDHGTGLGLAIVDRIADLHGWDVAVTDAASGGARFELRGTDSN